MSTCHNVMCDHNVPTNRKCMLDKTDCPCNIALPPDEMDSALESAACEVCKNQEKCWYVEEEEINNCSLRQEIVSILRKHLT